MQICVNGTWHKVGGATLEKVLSELGYQDTSVATALNGTFVAKGARGMTSLKEGDKIEIVAPMQGG